MSKLDAKKAQPVRCKITCRREGAAEVFVAGTFNGWNPRATPMRRESGSEGRAELDLIPGTYEYKFVIDGEWRCELASDSMNVASDECIPNPFGTMNRKLEVS